MSDDPRYWYPPLALPANLRICQTQRAGEGWGFNLAGHVGAPPDQVAANRAALCDSQPGIAQIQWLTQVHGTAVVRAPTSADAEADAVWTTQAGVACAVMTADCLPILLWSTDGAVIVAIHAGWRGMVAGVIEATVAALPVAPGQLKGWLGPRIGPQAFEVGPEVRDAFWAVDPEAVSAFMPSARAGHFLADLGALAVRRLSALGLTSVVDSGACTVSDEQRWFSFRRAPRCGRMASLIWRI